MVNDWIILKYDCFLKFLCYNIKGYCRKIIEFNPKEGLIPRSLLRNKLMTNEVSLGLIPRSLLRGVSLNKADNQTKL